MLTYLLINVDVRKTASIHNSPTISIPDSSDNTLYTIQVNNFNSADFVIIVQIVLRNYFDGLNDSVNKC